jgi:hypothetical protein
MVLDEKDGTHGVKPARRAGDSTLLFGSRTFTGRVFPDATVGIFRIDRRFFSKSAR